MKKSEQDGDKIVDSMTVTKEKKKRAVVKFLTEESNIIDG